MYGMAPRTASPDRHRIRFGSSGLVAPSPSTSTALANVGITAASDEGGRPAIAFPTVDGRQDLAAMNGEGPVWSSKKGEDAAERGQNGHHLHDLGRKGDFHRVGAMNGHAGGSERAEVLWHLLGGLRREIRLGARRALRLLDALRPRGLIRSPTSAGRLLTTTASDGEPVQPKRATHLVLILVAIISLYLLVTALLDSPTNLTLDPTIDPRTFQLLPQDWGDPMGRIKRDKRDEPLFVALEAERQRLWRDRSLGEADRIDDGWYAGDQALRDNRPASRFLCDDGRDGRPEGSLIFLGIFTTPHALAKRQLLRTLFKPDLPPARDGRPPLIDVAFVAARPPNDDWRYVLEKEKARYGDIEWFDSVPENIDTGKTAHFLQWVATGAGGRWDVNVTGETTGRRRARPQFVMKLDDDVGPSLTCIPRSCD